MTRLPHHSEWAPLITLADLKRTIRKRDAFDLDQGVEVQREEALARAIAAFPARFLESLGMPGSSVSVKLTQWWVRTLRDHVLAGALTYRRRFDHCFPGVWRGPTWSSPLPSLRGEGCVSGTPSSLALLKRREPLLAIVAEVATDEALGRRGVLHGVHRCDLARDTHRHVEASATLLLRVCERGDEVFGVWLNSQVAHADGSADT